MDNSMFEKEIVYSELYLKGMFRLFDAIVIIQNVRVWFKLVILHSEKITRLDMKADSKIVGGHSSHVLVAGHSNRN